MGYKKDANEVNYNQVIPLFPQVMVGRNHSGTSGNGRGSFLQHLAKDLTILHYLSALQSQDRI
jgi:hypothetical protein